MLLCFLTSDRNSFSPNRKSNGLNGYQTNGMIYTVEYILIILPQAKCRAINCILHKNVFLKSLFVNLSMIEGCLLKSH